MAEEQPVSLLTPEEKWHFELQGFLLLSGVVPESDLGEMRPVLDGWLTADEKVFPLRSSAADRSRTRPISAISTMGTRCSSGST